MLYRIIKPQIIKRFCHHSTETKFGRILDVLDSIQTKSNLNAVKVTKLEEQLVKVENMLVYNYFYTVLIIPFAIFWTR
jgi:preprotein translocase subunit SecY